MNKYCFLEITISDKNNLNKRKEHILYKNKIYIEVFNNIVPNTVKNFYSLCIENNKKKLSYKNNKIFRIVKDSFIQTGDVINNDGTGGESIYDVFFDDEIFYDEYYYDNNNEINHLHDEPFLLSMANNGPNTNNSQFIITIEPLAYLDGLNVVFGKVVKGISTILVMNGMSTYIDGKLYNNIEIIISDCGVIEANYNNEEINLEYEKSLCNQTLINISNRIKNICKELKNNENYDLVIQNCKSIDKILYDNYKFIDDKFVDKNNYYKIKINTCILKIICKYKIKDYKNVIIDAKFLLEIPEKYLTDKNKLQILFYKFKSIYEIDPNNEDLLNNSKKILEEIYFMNNNDVKMFMKELKKEEKKIDNLLKNIK